MVRSSFGAIRMQQLSHHTLSSVPAFSTFAFTVCPGFIWFNRLLLKARAVRRGVVRPISAGLQRARQHKSSGRRGPSFSSAPAADHRAVPLTGSGRGSGFPSSYCFPQFVNASSVVVLGSSLTMKARTVTISSGHAVLFQADTRTQTQRARGFFLEVFDRHRGRQSRNESQENYNDHDSTCAYDSNTIYEHAPCFLREPAPSQDETKFCGALDRTLSGIY
jgi:hypothetical protein